MPTNNGANQIDVPVYLFTGFLEGGKTKFIQETMEDKRFNSDEQTLILLCEEGEEELDLSTYPSKNVTIQTIDEPEELNPAHLEQLLKNCSAKRVVMEYNGMWQVTQLFQSLPDTWAVYQEMCFVDATTFLQYNTNMRNLVVDKLSSCELVIFNRFQKSMDKMEFHKIVRGISQRTDIAYEYADGTVEYDDIEDPLPFDVNAPVIQLKDNDYALWYRDIMEDPKKYDGKVVSFRGLVAVDPSFPPKTFAVGRHVMTCCVEDITYSCVVAEWDNTNVLQTRQWIQVTGKIQVKRHKLYRGKGPVFQVQKVVMTSAPKQEVATFY
ncbi:MAG: TIGR03943 family protein [Ruminococcus sp.]|nr:TIGR03943 family protein [Ruminococcus sp.]